MKTIAGSAVLTLVLAAPAYAQTDPHVVKLPSLSLTGSTVDASVTYDASRRVYRYEYTIHAAPTNKAKISMLSVDVNGRTPHQQIDPDLVNNVTRRETRAVRPVVVQPATSLPVGLSSPMPTGTIAGVGMEGRANFNAFGTWDVAPGATLAGFVIESKFPPGPRTITLGPSDEAWIAAEEAAPEGAEFEVEAGETDYHLTLAGVGPSELTDADLFDGIGQQPAEVNKFLRFATPKDNRIKVPAGVTSQYVIVYYGMTIIPATFQATLNGVDITPQFHPAQGAVDVIRIPIAGTTKLHLRVEGLKTSGGRATDSDTLTFLPQ